MNTPQAAPLNTRALQARAHNVGYTSVRVYPSIDSTNLEAMRLLKDAQLSASLGELSAVLTLNQTGGKGRLNRSWSAPAGSCLATTIIVRPRAGARPIAAEAYHWATQIAALAVVDIWRARGARVAGLKWPNDILVSGSKGCGILATLITEADGTFSIAVGVGQNLNMTPEQLPVATATSLSIASGSAVDNQGVAADMLEGFARYWGAFCAAGADPEQSWNKHLGDNGGSLLDRVRACMVTLGTDVSVHLPDGSRVNGRAVDMDSEGRLVVEAEGRRRVFDVGDVEHLRAADGTYAPLT